MKKLIFILLLGLITSFSYGQSKSEMPGIWKATVKAGDKPTAPTFILFNSDGSYIWGIDSSGNTGTGNISKGKWDLTMDSNIKLIPDDITAKTVYYVKISDNMYRYEYYDKKGVKIKDNTPEMDLYLERIGN